MNHTLSVRLVCWRHPFRRGYLGDARNEYGTTVSVIRCRSCRTVVTFCPAFSTMGVPPGSECLGDLCPSYDPYRDIEWLFTDAPRESPTGTED